MSDTRRRIVMDGLNLGLQRGTGIATYGRNVARVLSDTYRMGVLYDRDVDSVPDDELLLEQRFYSPAPDPRLPSFAGRVYNQLRRLRRRVGHIRRSLGTVVPREISSSFVLHEIGLPNHPKSADILSSASLFQRAHLALSLTGKPLRVRLPPGDILHLTSPIPIISATGPTLLTVHDVIPLRMPFAVDDPSLYFLRTLRAIAKRVDHIVTVSESAKADLIAACGVDEDKVTVTYQPVREPDMIDARLSAQLVKSNYGLKPKEYFIFVGAIEPKKNIPRLIEAYLSAGVTKPLLIIGPDGWRVDEQLDTLRHRNSETFFPGGDIRRIGWVPRLHLQALIRNAKGMLFPSLYEGFGLPVVEAQLLGTPVLTSDAGSLGEVAGEGAILVDALQSANIADAIRWLDQTPNDAPELQSLIERGLRNTARFSEAAFARSMMSTLQRIS